MLTNDLPASSLPEPPLKATSLRRRLRAESNALHERLDACFDGMTAEARPDIYRRFLRMNEACHRIVEPILAASRLGEAAPSFALRRRAPALSADLAAMGLAPIEAPAFAPAAPGAAEAVGIAYVVVGSRLGAGYILADLRRRDLGDAWASASFAYLEEPDAPHALRGLLDEASARLDGEADAARAVGTAEATFRYFLDVETLTRLGAEP